MKTLKLTIASLLAVLYAAAQTQSNAPKALWKFKTAGAIISSPVIDGGVVYVGSLDSNFYALDVKTGAQKWKVNTRGQIRSTAGIHDDKLIFISGDGLLYCLNKFNGKTIWAFKTGGEKLYPLYSFADYYQSSPQIKDGRVYFGSGDGNVYAVNETDGSLIWKYTTGDIVHSTPAIEGDKLYIGSFDGYVYALNTSDGQLIWKFKSVGRRYFPRGEMQGTPIVHNGIVVIASRDYNLYGLDAKTGTGVWNRQFPRGWAMGTPYLKDSILYVGTSDDHEMHAIDPQTGISKWKTDVGFNIFGGVATQGQTMYFGTLMGKLFALDSKTGAVKCVFLNDGYHQHHLDYFKADDSRGDDFIPKMTKPNGQWEAMQLLGSVFSAPVIAEGKLVFTAMDGQVYCLDITT